MSMELASAIRRFVHALTDAEALESIRILDDPKAWLDANLTQLRDLVHSLPPALLSSDDVRNLTDGTTVYPVRSWSFLAACFS
jgi:hypothetical protein